MKYYLSLFLLWIGFTPLYSQVPDPLPFGKTITMDELRAHLYKITSEEMEGREVGTEGARLAADYIASQFNISGLQPAAGQPAAGNVDSLWFQKVPLVTALVTRATVSGNGWEFSHQKEIICTGGNTQKKMKVPLIFAGEGLEDDYKNLDVKGKAVLIRGDSEEAMERKRLAAQHGAVAFLAVISTDEPSFLRMRKYLSFYLSRPRMAIFTEDHDLPAFAISPAQAARMMRMDSRQWMQIRPGQVSEISVFAETETQPLTAANVVGMVEGTDKKEEVLVITAHYDHLGKKGGKIYPGADDNGSGVVALLEVAEAFALAAAKGFPPRRTILFMALTAEEKGLFGSEYYSTYPIFPLSQTVVNLNMDMVGHLDQNHTENARFVTVVGSDWLSSELHEIHERANREYVQLELDYSFNSPSHPEMFYYRSDQYNFAKYGIPVIFYTSADHEDYHKASDTVDKIKFDRIEGVAQLLFYTAWEIANRENRLKVDRTPPK
ncbi:MAG: M28 family peptidase [Bacteroidia bacterium]